MLRYVQRFVDNCKIQFRSLVEPILKWNIYKYKTGYNRYQISNKLVFDQSEIQNDEAFQRELHKNLQFIPHEKHEELIKQYIKQIFILPFIEFLQMFVAKGANPHAKVDRLEFYRLLDEHKKHLTLVSEAKEAVDAV
jgi:hypothetical protein